jgi:polyferredoxin
VNSSAKPRLPPSAQTAVAVAALAVAVATAFLLSGGLAAAIVAGAGAVAGLLVLLGSAVDLRSLVAGRHPSGPAGDVVGSWRLPLLAWLLAGDALFAALLNVARLTPNVAANVAPSLVPLVSVLVAPGFLLVAGAEILLLALIAYPAADRTLRLLLVSQAAMLLLTPTIVAGPWWGPASAYLGAALIVAMFVVALQYLYRHKQVSAPLLGLLVRWPLAALFTGAGWFLWTFEGLWYPLAVAVAAQLALALYTALSRPLPTGGERTPWLLRPFSIFEFLLFTFLAEFFLGALLDYRIVGPTFLQYIPFVPTGALSAHAAGVAVYNGLWFGAAILASAWFLIILGFTMGPLVLLKIRETHEPAQKYRLGLTVAAYALAAVYLPSFASSTPITNAPWLANLPVIGWGFGLRDGGPFESGVFLAVIAMYVLVGTLTVLFGRKAICAVMCGAALMYQGTAMNEMRGFNQTSRVGRHFLGSQLSTAYVVMSGVALASLFAVSLLSVLRWIPAVQVANGQLDTAALPLPIELYFGGIWFVMFVTTPYIGTYNCATTGFCHWGALTLPFASIGFFRLKVKDKKVCQACTTFDCAKACPVGLVDMPLFFRRDGEYRSSKCCGVGDCVGACPYGNMYHQDVRFWLRRKLGRGEPAPQAPIDRGTPLPMIPVAAPRAVAPTSAEAAPATGAAGSPHGFSR